MRRMVLVMAGVCVVAAAAAAVTVAVLRVTASVPLVTVAVRAPARLIAAPGQTTPIPLPSAGSMTLSQGLDGVIADQEGAAVRPIGSIAKTMTALLILALHPLQPGEQGPLVTMTPADVALYREALSQQGSAVAVDTGERWSERDMLLALMLPSANNIAETLARWASGDRKVFIGLLNQRAAALSMTRTHFDDPSGVSAATVSTTRDLVLLGRAALGDATLAGIVSTRSAVLPDGAAVVNLDVLLSSQPGWLGIKTGWTPNAGGCLLFAAEHTYATGTPPVVLIGAVLAQPPKPGIDPGHPELGGAVQTAQLAVSTAFGNQVAVDFANLAPHVTGSITTPWSSTSTLELGRADDKYTVVARGASLVLTTSVLQLRAPLTAGAQVGQVYGVGPDGLAVKWTLRTAGAVAGPSLWWKLFHG
jgi:serine-type D-Ala-D-Ala carboxypeptidase (penicillin-binding protein 5/6)